MTTLKKGIFYVLNKLEKGKWINKKLGIMRIFTLAKIFFSYSDPTIFTI
jgi:hypothetical protein